MKTLFSSLVHPLFCMLPIALSIMAGPVSTTNANNPWASEVGEAKDVRRTAEEITRRLNEEHPFSRVADEARSLEQQSSQLLRIIRDGADWNRIVISLNNTKAVYCNLKAVASQDCKTRDDRSLQRSIEAFDRRFNRLEAALIRRYEKLTPTICPPVHNQPVHILPVTRPPVYQPPFYQVPPRNYHREHFPTQAPNYRVEYSGGTQFHYEHSNGRQEPVNRSAGRQVISLVLNELVNRL